MPPRKPPTPRKRTALTTNAWAIVTRRGDILTGLVRAQRRFVIEALCGNGHGWQSRWAYWLKVGHTARRVRITEVTPARKAR